MCGIAGFYTASERLDGKVIHGMVEALRHRGPDDEGYACFTPADGSCREFYGPDTGLKIGTHIAAAPSALPCLFFGHRRLSILDLTTAGHQPMSYEGGRLWLVYNGEIYNYRELRETLKTKGYEFVSNSDTEVVLAAYSEWGDECVKQFNGDWAFALYDRERKTVMLSRDRYGIKPLYYAYYPNLKVFAFASEIKALLKLPYLNPSINRERCFEYIVFGILEHTSETMYRDVLQVEPGCNLTFDLSGGRIKHSRHYELSFNRSFGSYGRQKALAYADDIRDLLTDSVRLRLRADVPIGTCLSGGLDSSSIVVIISKLLNEGGIPAEMIGEKQSTFTASFSGEAVDETKFAGMINDFANSRGHQVYPKMESLRAEIGKVMHHQDEPFGSASIYAQWKVMEKASESVKVILDGQGGDEVFGGYANYRSAYLAQAIKGMRPLRFLLEMLGAVRMNGSLAKAAKSLKGLPLYLAPESIKIASYILWKKGLIDAAVDRLGIEGGSMPFKFFASAFVPNLNEVLYSYQMKYSLQQLLRYEDRNSMAFSIESRTPFTDYRLVDYVFSIPAAYKFRNGWSKWLLRLAMRGRLPDDILWRKDKIGFEVSREMMMNYGRLKLFDIWTDSFFEGDRG